MRMNHHILAKKLRSDLRAPRFLIGDSKFPLTINKKRYKGMCKYDITNMNQIYGHLLTLSASAFITWRMNTYRDELQAKIREEDRVYHDKKYAEDQKIQENNRLKDKYDKYLPKVNNPKYRKLSDQWNLKLMGISSKMDPVVIYNTVSNASDNETKDLDIASAHKLWNYYNDDCRSLLKTNRPDVGKTVFGDHGKYLKTLNGLLSVRLASIIPSINLDENKSEAVEQLYNYESICAHLEQNHEDTVLEKVITMKQLCDLCIISTGSDNKECQQFKKDSVPI